MSLDKIIGMYYIQPSPLCRSASPLLNSGYGIIDHGYHDSGIGRIGWFLYGVIAKQVRILKMYNLKILKQKDLLTIQ